MNADDLYTGHFDLTECRFTLVTGELGAGKTTLMQKLLGKLDETVTFGLISNAQGGCGELLHWVLRAFSVETDSSENYVTMRIEADYAPDIMFFDMPPQMSTDDNFGFLKKFACTLLLAEAERTTVDQINLVERQLAEQTNVMGVVFNKSHYIGRDHGYGYGYV